MLTNINLKRPEPTRSMYDRGSTGQHGLNPRANYVSHDPKPEPFNHVRTLPDEVAAVVREISDIRKTFECQAVAYQLSRVFPYLSGYDNDRTNTAILIQSLLTTPQEFSYERLRRIASFTADKLKTLPLPERRSLPVMMTRATGANRTVKFIASTSGLDRHGTKVLPMGIDTSRYEQNNIVLWAHDGYGGWSSPKPESVIGRTVALRKSETKLEADVEFLPESVNPTAQMVFAMVKAGAVSAVSIGFVPREVLVEVDQATGKEVPVISKSELLEISVVPIPSNPEALVTGRAS